MKNLVKQRQNNKKKPDQLFLLIPVVQFLKDS